MYKTCPYKHMHMHAHVHIMSSIFKLIKGQKLDCYCLFLAGESHAVLTVHLYKEDNHHLECKELNFVYEDFTEKNMPMLIVYSNDPSLARVNYQALAHKAITENNIATAPTNVLTRRRRRSAPPACAVHPLHVRGSEIFAVMGERNRSDLQVVSPITYNAGICGGGCDRTHPQDANIHARFVHALLASSSFRNQHRRYSFTQCCAPVQFEDVRVLSHSKLEGEIINVYRDLKLTRCNCIDIISQIR